MSQVRKVGRAGRRGNMARNLMLSPPRLYAESQAARYAVCRNTREGPVLLVLYGRLVSRAVFCYFKHKTNGNSPGY